APLPDPLPWPRLVPDTAALAPLRARLDLDTARPVLALCPGAEFGPAKQWPPAHYAAVAAHYLQRGWQVWLLGSARDAPVGQAIVAQVAAPLRGHLHDLCGSTSLSDAVLLLGQAQAVVSNDSGLMHVAAALGR